MGVIKKTIPEVPKPASSTPFKNKNNGITVIAPAKNNCKEIKGSWNEKKLFPSTDIK